MILTPVWDQRRNDDADVEHHSPLRRIHETERDEQSR